MSTTISGTSGVTFPDSTSMQTGQQACKAWVNFNGQGTVAIRGGYNVSSITDNGTGNYTVNFTTAMPDANYAVFGKTVPFLDTTRSAVFLDVSVMATTSVTVLTHTATPTAGNYEYNFVAIFSN